MNKFEIIKKVTKNPLPLGTPFGAPEVIKLITLIAATCFAGKVEEIIKDLMSSEKSSGTNYIDHREDR